jgi:hypothetical protein
MFGSNHDPLRAPRREANPELRPFYTGRLQHARNTLALEQTLNHLGLDSIAGEHDLDQVGAAWFLDLDHGTQG